MISQALASAPDDSIAQRLLSTVMAEAMETPPGELNALPPLPPPTALDGQFYGNATAGAAVPSHALFSTFKPHLPAHLLPSSASAIRGIVGGSNGGGWAGDYASSPADMSMMMSIDEGGGLTSTISPSPAARFAAAAGGGGGWRRPQPRSGGGASSSSFSSSTHGLFGDLDALIAGSAAGGGTPEGADSSGMNVSGGEG